MLGKKKKWVPTIATDDSDYEGRELEPENNHEGKESEDIKKTKKLDGGKKRKKGKRCCIQIAKQE